MKVWHSPTGKVIHGHVLDVNRRSFERALKDYDKQLYTVWNPKKMQGWGCWEIRRTPNQKRAIHVATHEGVSYFKVMYVENRDIHHVLDCAFLNYDALRKLQDMDLFRIVADSGYGHLSDLMDAKARDFKERTQARAEENLRHTIRDNRSAMRDFYEMVRSGIHPAQVLKSTKWVHNT